MIPLLILGVAAGGIFTAAGQSVIKDSKEEIESINDESQKMIDDTTELVEQTNEKMNKTIKKLENQRTNIYKSTLKRASNITEKIKITSDKKLNNSLTEIREQIEGVDYSIATSAQFTSGIVTGISALGGLGGLVVGTLISGVALEYKIDEARANRSKIRAECEKAKLKCSQMDNRIAIMLDANKTIRALDKLTVQSEDYVEEIFIKKGYNSAKWNNHEIEAVRTMFNFVKALSDIINSEIFTDDGEISDNYRNLVEKADEIVDEQ